MGHIKVGKLLCARAQASRSGTMLCIICLNNIIVLGLIGLFLNRRTRLKGSLDDDDDDDDDDDTIRLLDPRAEEQS
jgi:hypothetical protein